jgi:hypothetical protein
LPDQAATRQARRITAMPTPDPATLSMISPEDVIRHLRERQITLTYDPASDALRAGAAETAQTITLTAS